MATVVALCSCLGIYQLCLGTLPDACTWTAARGMQGCARRMTAVALCSCPGIHQLCLGALPDVCMWVALRGMHGCLGALSDACTWAAAWAMQGRAWHMGETIWVYVHVHGVASPCS